MKIKTKLFLIVSLVVSIALSIVLVRYITTKQINRTSDISHNSETIVREVFGLNNLLNEYLLYHTKRAESQWLLQQKHINTILTNQQYTNTDDESILRKIIQAHKSNSVIFPRLIQAYQNGSPKELQDRLASQLLIKSQSMVENSIILYSRSSAETEKIRNNARFLTNLLIGTLILSVIILLFLLYQSIIGPITKLQAGSVHVAAGNWNYKVDVKSHDELGQLAEAFNNMTAKMNTYIKQMKVLEKQKDDFIASASHELKTPVTSIKIYADILQRQMMQTKNSKSIELFQKMNTQITKLSILINDLLDINKIASGQLRYDMENFDINTLIGEILQEIQPTANGVPIIQDLAKSKQVYGDRNRIGQVLINLISNALKYSPSKGKVLVHSKFTHDDVILSVQDFGIGISKTNQGKIFNRFFRVHGKLEQTYPGLGLGLYISKQIVKRHHGKIWVKSKEGKGSTFYVSLPVS